MALLLFLLNKFPLNVRSYLYLQPEAYTSSFIPVRNEGYKQ